MALCVDIEKTFDSVLEFWSCTVYALTSEIFQTLWVFTILLVPQTKELAGLNRWFRSFQHQLLCHLSLRRLFSSLPQPQSLWGSQWHMLPARSVYCLLHWTKQCMIIFTWLHYNY